MKPAIELVKDLNTDRTYAFNQYGENPASYRAFDGGMNHAAELLQAWLREVDEWLVGFSQDFAEADKSMTIEWLRSVLLGTTRTEEKK